MKNRLSLLFTLSFSSICIFADSIPAILGPHVIVHSILSVKDFVSYCDILLCIFSLLIVVPFIYIGYLKNHPIPEEHKAYHFEGEYSAKNIKEYIEGLEILFGKRFLRFRQSLDKYDKESARNLRKHAEVIDSILFCIKLNGRKRVTVFWDLSDSFLKGMILSLPVIGIIVVIISQIYFGVVGLLISIIPGILIMPLLLIIFSSFLQFTHYIFRKTGKPLPALSLGYFALDALINRQVARSFDSKSGEYFYYTMIHQYNNMVNADFRFSKVYIRTSSDIYGNLKEQAVGEK
ncbi:hypothetical protein [Parabacteroides sp. FAFU027]|uniref:hypothetical protein n=1 Tax=Parabacteroides sp. FAFU027 TaxID=2922715 RepID=UPI001FB00220|nr:hypothetical protein [Parabacteroides sp. FAFU027]